MENEITLFGKITFRNQQTRFGIKTDDRRRHMYIVGKTGTGKTNLLENMAIADIRAGRGIAVVDPHGEFAEKLLDFVPENRIDDVIYFNPADMSHPIAFNPLEQVDVEYRHLVASGMMGVFKKIWPDVWSARMEYILNNTLLALLEYPGSTLLGIMRMLAEKDYRQKIVNNLQDPIIKAFWTNEFARYTQRLETEAVAAIQNKVGQFVANPIIRNIIGQTHSTIDMQKIMDEGKILIINLSKGKIGEDNSALLGAMMITKLQLAAMNRVNLPIEKRRDFYLYVDEFQNFSTESFANILSEARKYRLNLILAHQYISQLVNDRNTKVRDAVFGNVGTIACFRIGADDAEYLEREFTPEFVAQDLVNLAKYHIYVKLMIDGVASKPFSAETLEPAKPAAESFKDVIIENSRNKYAAPRSMVEEKIAGEWAADARIIEDKINRREERPLERVLKPQPYAQPYKQPHRESQPEKPTVGTKDPDEQSEERRRTEIAKKKHKLINIEDLKKAIEESLKKRQ
ncbi:MAG: type IV secretion system DNA-binding domain-containing protein [Patescibacteria group bacterium]